MDGMNVNRIGSRIFNPELYVKKIKQDSVSTGSNNFNSTFSQMKPGSMQTSSLALENMLQMNQLANIDRSVYIKNLLGLPQNLSDLLRTVQTGKPLNTNSLVLNDLNEELLKNQKILSEIFDEINENSASVVNNKIPAQQKDAVLLMFNGMVQLSAVSEIILKNSKQAVAGLIIAMSSASKNGLTSEQINETLGMLNSCIALAESGNPAQTLKSLLQLYLPWLPLNEEVGFDLEIDTESGENESNDSKLTVLVQTRNFGNVKGVFTLTTSNSVDICITCAEGFPKKTLQQCLKREASNLAMNTNIDVETVQPLNTINEKTEAKVNLSATNEMNPYLLLMAHSFIRNTIDIDSNGIVEDSVKQDAE